MDHDSPRKNILPYLKRCIERLVYNASKEVTKKHMDGFDLEDSFGSLDVFCGNNLFSDLMREHNDPKDAYHFQPLWIVALDSQVTAERDIVCVTFGSVWMLLNAFWAIVPRWGFQLNGNVTGKLCSKSINLASLVLNPFLSKHNNILSLGVVPKGTESEKNRSDDMGWLSRSCCSDVQLQALLHTLIWVLWNGY
jgi:hypothetical protein